MANLRSKLLLLGVLAISCSACSSKGHWKHTHLNTGTEFSSSKIAYVFPDPNNSIKLDTIRSQKSYNGYLSVNSHPIVPSSTDPKKAKVSLQIQNDTFSFLATRHEGGHRLLLPEEALGKILLALSQNIEVILETSGYKTTLKSEGFSSTYKKFQNPSRLPKLIQLPL